MDKVEIRVCLNILPVAFVWPVPEPVRASKPVAWGFGRRFAPPKPPIAYLHPLLLHSRSRGWGRKPQFPNGFLAAANAVGNLVQALETRSVDGEVEDLGDHLRPPVDEVKPTVFHMQAPLHLLGQRLVHEL